MRARSRKQVLAAAVLGAALAAPVSAQVAAAPLPGTDPWGIGWISANDGPLPPTIWDNTGTEALTPLFTALKPRELAPSARQALRRLLMSKSKGPGSLDLIPERLRLLEQVGESESAVDLRRRSGAAAWAQGVDRVAADLALARGDKDGGCGIAASRPASDAALLPVRALCAALNGDAATASRLAEQVAAKDEATGVWLLAALGAVVAPDLKKPEGRYATPFEATVSVAGKFAVPANALAGLPADIAAGIAKNASATTEQRRAALRPAVEGGKLSAAEVLAVLNLKPETPAAPPGRGAAARPDALAQALATLGNAEAKADKKAADYAAALKAAATLTDARIASLALLEAVRSLPRNDATLAYAEVFARASLVAGDVKLAGEWRKHMGALAKDKQDDWAMARLDLMLSLAGAQTEAPAALLDRMIAAVQPKPDAKPAAASTSGEQQLAIRRIENTRVMFLHVGTGRALTTQQRALLASMRTAGRGVSDAAIARITSAASQDADGEAALAAIGQLGGDVSAISFAGLSDLLTQLRIAGLEVDSRAIALESLQPWKAF